MFTSPRKNHGISLPSRFALPASSSSSDFTSMALMDRKYKQKYKRQLGLVMSCQLCESAGADAPHIPCPLANFEDWITICTSESRNLLKKKLTQELIKWTHDDKQEGNGPIDSRAITAMIMTPDKLASPLRSAASIPLLSMFLLTG